MATVKVFYPEVDGKSFSADLMVALRRLEPVIVSRAVALFDGTPSYHWEQDPAVASGNYARLVRVYDGREILSEPKGFLAKCGADEFESVLVRRSHELTREDEARKRTA